jgi:hypothetical protein
MKTIFNITNMVLLNLFATGKKINLLVDFACGTTVLTVSGTEVKYFNRIL